MSTGSYSDLSHPYYLLGENGEITGTHNVHLWSLNHRQRMKVANLYVASKDTSYHVSTVWIGVPHHRGLDLTDEQGRPFLFETMIFEDGDGIWQDRYSTLESALAGHNAVCNRLREQWMPDHE